MGDVLEHLPDPGGAVTEVYRLLEPGGVFYLTVPDAGSRLAKVMGKRWWSVLPMHLQYFTRSSMRRLLTDRGFEVIEQRSHPKVFSVRYYVARLAAFTGVRLRSGSERLVAPNFHDRMEVIAAKR
jgi:SAM-dependent methyltransferase